MNILNHWTENHTSTASPAAMEPLEPRLLLSAAIEVWGGNANHIGDADYYYNIDQHGSEYVKLGESNAANGTPSFSSGTIYNYYVIATRTKVDVDAVQGSDSTSIGRWPAQATLTTTALPTSSGGT